MVRLRRQARAGDAARDNTRLGGSRRASRAADSCLVCCLCCLCTEMYVFTVAGGRIGVDPWFSASPSGSDSRPSLSAYKSMSTGVSPLRSALSPAAALSAARPAHRRPHDLNRLPSCLARPVRALEHLARVWHRTQPERRLRHTWRRGAGQKASWARPQWPGQAALAWPRRGSPHVHRLTWPHHAACASKGWEMPCVL